MLESQTDHASDTQPSLYHPLFAKVLQQYTNREPILFPNETCIGECQIEIVAPGWDVDCSETTEPYILATMQDGEDYSDQTSLFPNGTVQNSTYNGPTFDQTVFRTEVVYNYTLSNIERLGNHGAMQVSQNPFAIVTLVDSGILVRSQPEDDVQEYPRFVFPF